MRFVCIVCMFGLGCAVNDPMAMPNSGDPITPGGNLILVDGGKFNMGSEDFLKDEKPTHIVMVNSFMIGKTEVTVGEFRAFINSTGYKPTTDYIDHAFVWDGSSWIQKDNASWRQPNLNQADNHPVVCVSWYDVVAYCNWLSDKAGLKRCYTIEGENVTCDFSVKGYRMPTEAEWEFAARGGNNSAGFTFSGSNDVYEVSWSYRNSGGTSHPVGGKKANELGLYDMSGNVLEWCWDRYDKDYYRQKSDDNPLGPISGEYRVVRGGGWHAGGDYCTSRKGVAPFGAFSDLGFRLAKSCISVHP